MADLNNSLGQVGSGGIAINQNNVDIVKYIYTNDVFNLQGRDFIINLVNSLPQYTISEIQSWWINIITGIDAENPIPTLLKYKVINKGKGTYGIGGIQLTFNDLHLITIEKASAEDIVNLVSTVKIEFGDIGSSTIEDYLNSQIPSITIQDQIDGYTILYATIDGVDYAYLFIGSGGTYGLSDEQSNDNDFQVLTNIGGTQNLDQTLTNGNTSSIPIKIQDSETGDRTTIAHNYVEVIEFDAGKGAFLTPNLLSFKRDFSNYYNLIFPSTLTTTKNVTFPNKTGTVAFLDDIPGDAGGFTSLQQMWDDNPNNLSYIDLSGKRQTFDPFNSLQFTSELVPSDGLYYTLLYEAIDFSEQALLNIAISRTADGSTVEASVSGQSTNGSGFALKNSLLSLGNEIGGLINLKTENVTAEQDIQAPNAEGTLTISATVNGGAKILADDEGNIDLGTISGNGITGLTDSGIAVVSDNGDGTWNVNVPATDLSGYQPLDGDLTAIAGLTTNSYGRDFLTLTTASNARTYIGAGTGNGTVTSVSGTNNRISITNGSTTPIIDIASAYIGQSSINTLGTITTGVWQGTAVADTYISSATTWNAKVASTRTININGTTQDLSANRTWNVGDALVSNSLSQFASTTSAQLATVISDETGTGSLVFHNSPTFAGIVTFPTGFVISGGLNSSLVRGDGSVVNVNTFISSTPTNVITNNNASIATGDTVVQIAGKAQGQINAIKGTVGSSTQSGTGAATSFNIAHGLGAIPTYFSAVANNAATSNIQYITADATNITVFYSVAPANGTNNLTWKWFAR